MKIKLSRHQPKQRTYAFTLIEVLVGTAIFGIMFTSLYAGLSSGLAVIRSNRENLRATQIMLEKMETIRLYNWDQVNSNGFIPVAFSAPYWPNDGSNGMQYHGTMSVTNVPFTLSYSTNMRQVILNISWHSGSVTHQREMRTYISRYGLQNYIY